MTEFEQLAADEAALKKRKAAYEADIVKQAAEVLARLAANDDLKLLSDIGAKMLDGQAKQSTLNVGAAVNAAKAQVDFAVTDLARILAPPAVALPNMIPPPIIQ